MQNAFNFFSRKKRNFQFCKMHCNWFQRSTMCLRVSYFVYLGLGLYLYLYWAMDVELDLNFTVRRPLSQRTYGNRPSLGPWHGLDQFIVRFVSVNVFPCCSCICICIFLSMHISLSSWGFYTCIFKHLCFSITLPHVLMFSALK